MVEPLSNFLSSSEALVDTYGTTGSSEKHGKSPRRQAHKARESPESLRQGAQPWQPTFTWSGKPPPSRWASTCRISEAGGTSAGNLRG